MLVARQRNQQVDVLAQTFSAPPSSPNPLVASFGTKRPWVRIPPLDHGVAIQKPSIWPMLVPPVPAYGVTKLLVDSGVPK
jgi:hypothetical protein